MLKISRKLNFLLDLLISVYRIKKWNIFFCITFLHNVCPQGRLDTTCIYTCTSIRPWCLLINLCSGTCGRHRLILMFISDKSVIFLINKDRQLLQAYANYFQLFKNLEFEYKIKLLCQIIWIPIFQCVSVCTNVHIWGTRQTEVHILGQLIF